MTIPTINKNQKSVIFYLYKFRYLTINQLQKLFNHKDPHRIKVWLNDLKDKRFIEVIKDKKDVTKPFIFCLATKAQHILKEDKDCDQTFFKRLYKEKDLSENFKAHCLFVVDTYLFFLARKEEGTEINFFTHQDLTGYEYFPKDLDAYIAVEGKDGTDRYLLDLFDEYRKPAPVCRYRVREYIRYSEDGNWQANTDNAAFPTILLILHDEKRKKHIYYYAKSLLEKSFENIDLFLTTQAAIKFSSEEVNIWQKVE